MSSIVVPGSVRAVGKWAFHDCVSLRSATIHEGVKKICDGAFSGCEALETVTLPRSLISIGPYAFSFCKKLKAVTLPDGIQDIGSSAFSNCESLQSIKIPPDIKTLGSVFDGCRSLETVELSAGLTELGGTFGHCWRLKSIKLPEGVVSIGKKTFEHSGLKSIVIPASVTKFGDAAFGNCSSLESITIPGSIREIPYGAFTCCNNLKSVTICPGVERIDDIAFYECKRLESVSIPSSLEFIRYEAFEGCEHLLTVYVEKGMTETVKKRLKGLKSIDVDVIDFIEQDVEPKTQGVANSLQHPVCDCKNLRDGDICNEMLELSDGLRFFAQAREHLRRGNYDTALATMRSLRDLHDGVDGNGIGFSDIFISSVMAGYVAGARTVVDKMAITGEYEKKVNETAVNMAAAAWLLDKDTNVGDAIGYVAGSSMSANANASIARDALMRSFVQYEDEYRSAYAKLSAKGKHAQSNCRGQVADIKRDVVRSDVDRRYFLAKEAGMGNEFVLILLGDEKQDNLISADVKERARILGVAADAGSPVAQMFLAQILIKSKTERDSLKAIGLWCKAADADWSLSERRKRDVIRVAETLGLDVSQGIRQMSDFLTAGNLAMKQAAAEIYEQGVGVAQSPEKAFSLYRQLADSGDVDAQTKLGIYYHQGFGVAKSQSEALKWYRKASAGGSAMAQNNLGWAYYTGNGVEIDYDKAFQLCKKAADTGLACAQDSVARCYFYGRGTAKRYSEAYKMFLLAAKQGNVASMYMLYVCLKDGRGCLVDNRSALEFLWKSADGGFVEAQYELGQLYEQGSMVKKDLDSAIEWYKKTIDHPEDFDSRATIRNAKERLSFLMQN